MSAIIMTTAWQALGTVLFLAVFASIAWALWDATTEVAE